MSGECSHVSRDCRWILLQGAALLNRLLYCRGVVHFDYVSGQGVAKTAATLGNDDLAALLWQKCNLSLEGEREQSLTPEKQMMRLRMLAPLIALNSTQVSQTHGMPIVMLLGAASL